MEAEEYKEKLLPLQKARGEAPIGWWISANDEENKKKPRIQEVIEHQAEAYLRELKYQTGLREITIERLKSAKPLKIDDNVYVLNEYQSHDKCYLYAETRAPHEKIAVKIEGAAIIDSDGLIWFQVCFKPMAKEIMAKIGDKLEEVDAIHFTVLQDGIL